MPKGFKVAKERSRPRSLCGPRWSNDENEDQATSRFFPRRTKWISPIAKTERDRWRDKETVVARVRAHGATHPSAGGPWTIHASPRPPHPRVCFSILLSRFLCLSVLFCSLLISPESRAANTFCGRTLRVARRSCQTPNKAVSHSPSLLILFCRAVAC